MDMLKIAFIGVIGVILAIQFKGTKSEYGIYIGLATSLIILFCIADKLSIVIDAINKIQGYIQLNTVYLTTLAKIIGITYIAEFASGICKDAGYSAIAGQIEVFAKISVMALSMPVLIALLETIDSFLS
ncbi:SpoIIIAC/SpoIIIAD family protein [Candidatus Galacturonibacter soehngenii]|uniref:Stage III sporulation protein AD n=1 Tax=Candidatus Galacturonatibacter soehngenii TaxID=2307010 RepID=A0A7V7UC06_9FIRM|nr:SpoIIIAC/SpoIIIAD family protein [Candidatus Galacturonibacter soehngenii]KAB1438169.1 stage III sporulation protein AD [Candidatus Galacturonibacter soehngenii]MBA4687205.1 stage III sporulation protein AD [Candidatus Galacturonibacter soehngenii]